MYGNDQIISYLQANKILALKLDHAVSAVGHMAVDQVDKIGAGATRALYYTSCFTDEYQDVCRQQKREDLRFRDGVYKLLRQGDIVYDMLKIYFEELLKYKTSEQLEHIKKLLMNVNVHIAASSLTAAGFTLAAANVVRMGLNVSLEISGLAGKWVSGGVSIVGFYGLVQRAADSAHRLQIRYPAYYAALYAQELEMMFFLIEPVFERAAALNVKGASDSDIANIITRLIR